MKRDSFKTGWNRLLLGSLCFSFRSSPIAASAQNMADYTNYPIFLSQTVPPNILFLVDMGNYTLEAAYSGSNQRYWISFKAGTATDSKYSANVTVDSATGDDLVAADNSGVVDQYVGCHLAGRHVRSDQVLLRHVRFAALLYD